MARVFLPTANRLLSWRLGEFVDSVSSTLPLVVPAPAPATRCSTTAATKNDARGQHEPEGVPSAVVVHLVDLYRLVEERDDKHYR